MTGFIALADGTVFQTNDVDHRLTGPSDVPLEVERAHAAGMPVTYRDVERAKAILVVGLDAEQELPILHLRIRKAARSGTRVFVLHPRRTRLWDLAEHLSCTPGEEAAVIEGLGSAEDGSVESRIAAALRDAGDAGVVLAGPRLADSPGMT